MACVYHHYNDTVILILVILFIIRWRRVDLCATLFSSLTRIESRTYNGYPQDGARAEKRQHFDSSKPIRTRARYYTNTSLKVQILQYLFRVSDRPFCTRSAPVNWMIIITITPYELGTTIIIIWQNITHAHTRGSGYGLESFGLTKAKFSLVCRPRRLR